MRPARVLCNVVTKRLGLRSSRQPETNLHSHLGAAVAAAADAQQRVQDSVRSVMLVEAVQSPE